MTQQTIGFFFGALGIVANILIYQQKSGKKLLVYKLISDILWAAHYLLLGGISAFFIACISTIRESIFLNQKKKWARSRLWLVLFILLSIGSAAIVWKTAANLLPTIASILSVLSFWRNNPTLSKFLAFPISICMLIYDIYVASYVGIINEVFTIVSASVSFIFIAMRHSKSAK
jgi:hypothetical protein